MAERDFNIRLSTISFVVSALLSSILVLVCYALLDKPMVFWAESINLRSFPVLHFFQKIPHVFDYLAPLAFLYLGGKALFMRPFSYFDRYIFRGGIAVLAVSILKYPIKFVFARYWPSTFRENNLSLLGNGVFGFDFFKSGGAFESFPSGHTVLIVALATLTWFYYPRWRWLSILLPVLSAVGVIGLYYHFVSDVIAGAVLGLLTGFLVTACKIPECR